MVEPTTPPNDISRAHFEVVRKGYDQQEVRAFLHEVESLVDKLRRSERDFRERAERAETRLHMAENPDEEAMLELLGEETTRVLTSAREAAGEIRSKAEAAAERLIAEASAEAGAT
ncbi:MAG TPA: DivIVA domain-containing protein, partial [Acidimicrobiales bacterium]